MQSSPSDLLLFETTKVARQRYVREVQSYVKAMEYGLMRLMSCHWACGSAVSCTASSRKPCAASTLHRVNFANHKTGSGLQAVFLTKQPLCYHRYPRCWNSSTSSKSSCRPGHICLSRYSWHWFTTSSRRYTLSWMEIAGEDINTS